jgi:hypothetical protein
MSPIHELTDIVADAQKQAIASLKETAALSGRIFEANVNLAERFMAYQRSAIERFAGSVEQSK